MNYKTWLIPRLKRLNGLKSACEIIPSEIRTLELAADGIKATATDRVTVSGGDNRTDGRLIENLAEREELTRNLEISKRQVAETERALAALPETLYRVLEAFYIKPDERFSPAETLMEEFGYEKSQVYRMKDKALIELGIALFGICEE